MCDICEIGGEYQVQKRPIFTIGYGNREISDCIVLLKRYDIKFLIDVRSKPFSSFNPYFSKNNLEYFLKQNQIRYVFMGDLLGGVPQIEACYTNGRVDYSKVEQQLFYQRGISRLQTAWEKQVPVALMCSEEKPEECHRSKLIGRTLEKKGIPVVHIDQTGELVSQQEVIERISGGQLSLFEEVYMSNRKYL